MDKKGKYLFIDDDFFNLEKKNLNHTIGFRVDEKLYNQINKFAEYHQITKTDVVRVIVQSYFDNFDESIYNEID